MLYMAVKAFRDRDTGRVLSAGEVVKLPTERADVAIKQGYLRPSEANEALEFLVKNFGHYPWDWLHEGIYYAFEENPSLAVEFHIRGILDQLKANCKVALERGFYKWVRDKLELVYYLIWETDRPRVYFSALTLEDMTSGEEELFTVIRGFNGFNPMDMVLPKKEIAFALTAEGYIRPALPGEALRYLTANRDYPNRYFLAGAYYAFMHPCLGEFSEEALKKVLELFRDYEVSFERGEFNCCRVILDMARYVVWCDKGDLVNDVRASKI